MPSQKSKIAIVGCGAIGTAIAYSRVLGTGTLLEALRIMVDSLIGPSRLGD